MQPKTFTALSAPDQCLVRQGAGEAPQKQTWKESFGAVILRGGHSSHSTKCVSLRYSFRVLTNCASTRFSILNGTDMWSSWSTMW